MYSAAAACFSREISASRSASVSKVTVPSVPTTLTLKILSSLIIFYSAKASARAIISAFVYYASARS
jgi:hypothetical protein